VTQSKYLLLCLTAATGLAMPAAAAELSPSLSEASAVEADAPAAGAVTVAVAEWTRAKKGALAYIDAMPEDQIGFKPTTEVRSFAEQWLHVAGANYMFGALATDQKSAYGPPSGKDPEKMPELSASKEALRKFVEGSYDFMIAGVKSLDSSKMSEEVTFFNMKMSRSLLLAKAMEHHAHHRGQTTVYLRLKGVKPPEEMLF
jgi:uncharacterized damage-inducible protein DinB